MNVSVVIPLFNGQACIRDILQSVLAQQRPAFEVLVVDDGSTDGSGEIVRQFKAVRLLENSGRGLNTARRFGLEQATGSLVAVVEQEDIWRPEHLQRLVPVLEKQAETPGVVAGVERLTTSGPTPGQTSGEEHMLDPWEVFPTSVISTPSQVVFRAEVLRQHGGWDTRFPGLGDFHAWLTLTARRPLWQTASATVGRRAPPPGIAARRRNRWEFCDRYLSAAQDRVNLRLRYHPGEAAQVKRRLRLARHLFAWRFADAMLSPRQSAPLALQVDRLLPEESWADQRRLLHQAFEFFPMHEHPKRLADVVRYVQLWRRCPQEARQLRQSLRRYFAEQVGGLLRLPSA